MAHASERLADLLYDALRTADPAILAKMGAELQDFRTKFHGTYGLVRKQPFARNLLDAIVEAIDVDKEPNPR